MPPKGKKRAPPPPAVPKEEGSAPPQTPTLAESLSYLHLPRPFKNPYYTKNHSRRAKGLKYVLAAEREKTKQERERQKEANADSMEVDGQAASGPYDDEEMPTYTSIEAPPSVLPQKRYCDITGLEAPYTDPASKLRYHDKSVYELIKTLSPDTEKAYLAIRGVNPIVK